MFWKQAGVVLSLGGTQCIFAFFNTQFWNKGTISVGPKVPKERMLQNQTVTHRLTQLRRWGYAMWIAAIAGFAALARLAFARRFSQRLPVGFMTGPSSPMKVGMETRPSAHTCLGTGTWPGDFNPAVAVPVWPFLEGLLFFFTGVTVQAARALAVACFFLNLVLSYLLLRTRGPRWIALLGVTLVATSPFLYCFSRLAILEPLQIALTLAALNLAVRLPQAQRPVLSFDCDRPAVCAHRFDQNDRTFPVPGAALGDGSGRYGSGASWQCAVPCDDGRCLRRVRRLDGADRPFRACSAITNITFS